MHLHDRVEGELCARPRFCSALVSSVESLTRSDVLVTRIRRACWRVLDGE